jgi:hypothetical protein
VSDSWAQRVRAASAEIPRGVRRVALLLAGFGGAFLFESAAQAVLPASTERGVIVEHDAVFPLPEPPRYTIVAVLDSGLAVDLTHANPGDVYKTTSWGTPVLVTRSHLDGQVLSVRTPTKHLDTLGFSGAWIWRALVAVGVVVSLAIGLSDRRRDRWWVVAALVVSAGIASAWLWTGPEVDHTEPLPDGRWPYGSREPLPRVTAFGEPARVGM